MTRGVIWGPEGILTIDLRPEAHTLMCVPPTSMTRIFIFLAFSCQPSALSVDNARLAGRDALLAVDSVNRELKAES